MNAAENRRRLAQLRAGEDAREKGAAALSDSAELLHAARLFPKLGSLLDRKAGTLQRAEPMAARPGAGWKRMELRRGR